MLDIDAINSMLVHLHFTSRYEIFAEGHYRKLVVHNVKKEDDSIYFCKARKSICEGRLSVGDLSQDLADLSKKLNSGSEQEEIVKGAGISLPYIDF